MVKSNELSDLEFFMTGSKRRPRALGSKGAQVNEPNLLIRPIKAVDLEKIITIDTEATGIEKADYWRELFRRYGTRRQQRFFLVAEVSGAVLGFVIGEVRDWEFGSSPSGWIFGVAVSRNTRQHGVGSALLSAIFDCFRSTGVETVRTITGWDNALMLSFFRSQGMMAAPFIPLEFKLR